ncbi:MAG: hypothetical protein LBR64_02255 [Dysgonamonadaceae bacterium]|jgi:hypothetical protein|nr:hypothetical protein [Dysgonamonadaceae bacterium]
MELLATILIISLFTLGIYAATWQGKILNKPAEWLKKTAPKWVSKPVCGCFVCMSSFWSIVLWTAFVGFDVRWFWLPVIISAVAGLNSLILTFIIDNVPMEDIIDFSEYE